MRSLFYALCLFVPAFLQAQNHEQTISEAKPEIQAAAEKKRAEAWSTTIAANAAAMQAGELKPGFALYHIKSDTVQVPYLVYIPPSALTHQKRKLIVFLHGGINNTTEFDINNPDLPAFEPVFRVADSLHAIVLYPFGRKNFGWSKQVAAFQNVFDITEKIIPLYNIDRKHMVMTGISNGGTALFWFATQAQNQFRSFVALSATPVLQTGRIEFGKLTARKHFYTVNAKDDEVFLYTEVFKTYNANKTEAPGWHFETLESGNHGFIYNEGGDKILLRYLRKAFQEK